jgi:glutamyl/glutaminyl-tRNA synthetase
MSRLSVPNLFPSRPAPAGAEVAERIAARVNGPLLTRFAPAPTGALHLGHVVNAIYVWGLARALGGRVLLRIEDHDRQRSRAAHERALLDDLDWLGFDADVYPSECYRRDADLFGPRDADHADLFGSRDADRADLLGSRDADRADLLGSRDADRADLLGARDADHADLLGSPDADRADLLGARDADHADLLGSPDADRADLLGAPHGRQSERDAVYRAALAPLIGAGLIYGCCCSRGDLAAFSISPSGERCYPGTCRGAALALDDGVSWRVRMTPGTESFDDAVLGAQQQDPSSQCGDVLLRDRLGNWTYQCAATIDDHVQGVTLVVRGEDLLQSTGRQIRLARLLGRTTPAVFAHHPLIMKSAAQKLSKADGDTGVGDLRREGWSAAEIIGYAAHLVGLTADRAPVAARDLGTLFVR